MIEALTELAQRTRNCALCAGSLPHTPRPVFQVSEKALILIAGQAPGRKVQESGIPFDDPSGDRLGAAPSSVTEAVRAWRTRLPGLVPLPHPSPRNNPWLARNPWFMAELIPWLRERIIVILKTG